MAVIKTGGRVIATSGGRLSVGNCGTGAGGFQPGNTCAKGGGGSEGESGKAPYEKTGADLGTVYHGGKKKIEVIDTTKTQARDSGFYGTGFYVTTSPQLAETYGSKVTEFEVAPDASVLESSLNPETAPEGLVAEVKRWTLEKDTPRAEERGKLDALKEEVEAIDDNPLLWKDAVDRYAIGNGYDVVKHSSGEIVVKNPAVLTVKGKKKK